MSGRDEGLSVSEAWDRTQAALEKRAEEHRQAGWTIATAVADRVTPDPEWYHGPSFLLRVDADSAAQIERLVRETTAGFERTLIHRTAASDRVFVAVEARAPDPSRAVLFAFSYDPTADAAVELETSARVGGEIRTVLRGPEGDVAAMFTHGDAEPFFDEE